MKRFHVGELKTHFSRVLQAVKGGETIAVEYGRKHIPVAVLMPYDAYIANQQQRKLGLLEQKGSFRITPDFDISDEELLGK